ncbi:MAG: STN domain-containing protein [Burkholderiaceae bacterium]
MTLRGVTVREALESIRDVYGYDFRIDGRRITVYPPTLQTRIFMRQLPAGTSARAAARCASAPGRQPVPDNGNSNYNNSGNSSGIAERQQPGQWRHASPDSSQISTTSSMPTSGQRPVEALRGIVGNGQRPQRDRQPAVRHHRRARHARRTAPGRGLPAGPRGWPSSGR